MRRKIMVEAMGKNIIIDEPTKIKIKMSEHMVKPFYLKIKINNINMAKIRKALKASEDII